MAFFVAVAALGPVLREPDPRSEQVTQLRLGRTARIIETRGDWHEVQLELDGYTGWCHAGYGRVLEEEAAKIWAHGAEGWSEGATVDCDGRLVRVPLGGRVRIARHGIELPDGTIGKLLSGRIAPAATIAAGARAIPVDKWLAKFFGGTPYQWGGVTPTGTDCSGMIQTAFLARGTVLPRDSFLQADEGEGIELAAARRGDLLCFSENGRSVTHVALLGEGGHLVHASLSAGGFIEEPWGAGTRAGPLRDLFVTARHLPAADGPAQ